MCDERSEQLEDTTEFLCTQIGHSRVQRKENEEATPWFGKRKYCCQEKDNVSSKKLCSFSELSRSSQNEVKQDLNDKVGSPGNNDWHRTNLPYALIGSMYQQDLSMLCLLRKFVYEHRYPSLTLAFSDSEIDKFNDIVIRYEDKFIHVQIEHVDKQYINNVVTYARLFAKEKRRFSINDYFNSFVKHLVFKPYSSSDNIQYLIVYTNSALDITEEKRFRKGWFRNFYPFDLCSVNMKECKILKDFLFTNNDAPGRDFYQFSQDKTTQEELLNRLEFSSTISKVISERKLPEQLQRMMKTEFISKLLLAVNQPSREELHCIIKHEIEKNNKVQDTYVTLQSRILEDLSTHEKHKKYITTQTSNCTSGIVYEFSLFIFLLHTMFLNRNIISITIEEKELCNVILINYKNRITYIKAYNIDNAIDYSLLFSSKRLEKKDTFCINKYFALFVKELEKDLRYFIIYTNASLNLADLQELKGSSSKSFYPLKFDTINIQKKKYRILKDCIWTNENSLFYKFTQEETTQKKLLNMLNLPSWMRRQAEKGVLSYMNEMEIKKKFLKKLIFAVNQPNRVRLGNIIRDKIEMDRKSNKVPYDYEQLHEIALRWAESHEFGPITNIIMEGLLDDIENNRSSYYKIQNNITDEEIKFAKSVVGRDGTHAFNQFLGFLINGHGRTYLKVLRSNGINLSNMSSILHGAGGSATKTFKDLYNLWFDEQGNKTHYLKMLEMQGVKLSTISSVLHGARTNAAEAFKDLYDVWFDSKGNKTRCLEILEKEEINLANMSSILSGSGAWAVKTFRDLYNLWFDGEGNKTLYLETLEEEGISLANISSILGGAGTNAAKAFKSLYDLWFDQQGNKKQCLEVLKREGISLANMSSILHRARANASKAFTDLYDLWFDVDGRKSQFLESLEKERVNLSSISNILSGSGVHAARAFKDLYVLWFNAQGRKTRYLKTLEKEGIKLSNMSSILGGAGVSAAKAFKDLYVLWFSVDGNKTRYLKAIEKEEISLANMSSILHGAGTNSAEAFKDLYDLWFDEQGDKTQCLITLEKNGMSLSNVSSILHGAGSSAAKAFKDLYDLWFDAEGNKTQCLRTLEKEGINTANMASIAGGAGVNAGRAFKDLYDLWFDNKGNKTRILNDFIRRKNAKKSFTLYNLSSILSGTGAKAKEAFEKLHNTCFNEDGSRTRVLDDFYDAGFTPSNLSCILCKTGSSSSSALKKLHDISFNKKRKKTKYLGDFYEAGFRPSDLCSMLSGAPDCLKKLHDFCFTGETQMYLNHFLLEKDGFTLANLCNILHGARSNVCSALKDFHDICFDKRGNKTHVLIDFHEAGFTPNDLSNVLSMTGSNSTSVLRTFHKLCFNKGEYLNHFLSETTLFTPKGLSKMLCGVGMNICLVSEKFHDLCFYKTGNKTKYLKNVVENNPQTVLNILFEKVRGTSSSSRYIGESSTVQDGFNFLF